MAYIYIYIYIYIYKKYVLKLRINTRRDRYLRYSKVYDYRFLQPAHETYKSVFSAAKTREKPESGHSRDLAVILF